MAKKRVHRVRVRPQHSRLSRLSIVPERRLCCRCQGARANCSADLRTEVIQMEAGPEASIGDWVECGFLQGRIMFPKHESCSSSRWKTRSHQFFADICL